MENRFFNRRFSVICVLTTLALGSAPFRRHRQPNPVMQQMLHPKEKRDAAAPGERLPVFLPTNPLFQPLLADPRWPHFYVSFQRYINDEQLRNVASTNFGESFGIYRFRGPWKSTMELGFGRSIRHLRSRLPIL